MDKTHKVHNPGVNVCGSRVGTLVPSETGSGTSTSTGLPGVNALYQSPAAGRPSAETQRKPRKNASMRVAFYHSVFAGMEMGGKKHMRSELRVRF